MKHTMPAGHGNTLVTQPNSFHGEWCLTRLVSSCTITSATDAYKKDSLHDFPPSEQVWKWVAALLGSRPSTNLVQGTLMKAIHSPPRHNNQRKVPTPEAYTALKELFINLIRFIDDEEEVEYKLGGQTKCQQNTYRLLPRLQTKRWISFGSSGFRGSVWWLRRSMGSAVLTM